MSGPDAASAGATASGTRLSLALVFMAALSVYAPTLFAGFTNWDDPSLVVDNPRIRGFSRETVASWLAAPRRFDVPVAEASYALDYTLWGLRPLGFHLSNVLLHALCALLLCQLSRRLGFNLGTASIGAVLFALHPAGVEVVAWVSQRRTLVAAVFMLGSCLAYLRAEGRRAWPSAAACVFLFACSLLGKSVATAPLPILLPLLHKAVGSRWTRPRTAALVASLLLAVGAGVVKLQSHASEETFRGLFGGSISSHAAQVATVVGRYALKLILPIGLSPYYDFSAEDLTRAGIALGLVFAGAAIVLTGWLIARHLRAGVLALGAILFWLPTSSVLVPFAIPMADRYLYLPLLFLGPLAALAAERAPAPGRTVLTRLGMPVIVVLFALLTANQSAVWQSSLALWSRAVQVQPENPFARQKLAYTYWKEGDLPSALRQARRSVRIYPYWLEGWETLGQVALDAGRPQEAEDAFRQQIGLAQNVASAYVGIARARAARGQDPAALAAYAEALRRRADYKEAAERLTAFAREKGLVREALAALPTSPTSVWVELARGDLLESLGRREEAGRVWRRILLARPDFAPARERLASAAHMR